MKRCVEWGWPCWLACADVQQEILLMDLSDVNGSRLLEYSEPIDCSIDCARL